MRLKEEGIIMFDFKFDWDESLSLGVPLMDEQHKELFRIGRRLEQELLTGCTYLDEKQLLELLCEVREYVTYHFYWEEKWIQESKPDLFEEHKKRHNEFLQWVNSISCRELVENPQKGIKEIKDGIQKWLFEHIIIEDRKIFSKD